MMPEYIKLKNALRERIESATWTPGMRIPPRHQIMREYNLARATVDRAVNQLVREGLLTATKGSGTYVVDVEKQALQKETVYVVLHRQTRLTDTMLYPYLEALREGIESPSRIEWLTIEDMQVRPERFMEDARAFVFCLLAAGQFQVVRTLQWRGCPVLLMNRSDPDVDYVTTDTFAGLAEATEHVGTGEVGVVTTTPKLDRPYIAERIASFYRASSLRGLRTRMDWYVELETQPSEAGLERLFAMFGPEAFPETVFVAGNLLPYVLSALHAARLKPGRDVTLIHFDVMPETANRRGVISLEQDLTAMAYRTLEWLERVSMDGSARFQVRVKPRLLVDGQYVEDVSEDEAQTVQL